MPTYTYRREDGSKFEIQQKITEDALESCPTTGQSVKRVITGGAGLVFKGTGFYQTDYVKKSGAPESSESKSDSKKEGGSSGKGSSDGTETVKKAEKTEKKEKGTKAAKGSD